MSYAVSDHIRSAMEKLVADERIQKALAFIEADQPFRVEQNKAIALIQGESGKEHLGRSPYFKKYLEEYGVKDCRIDDMGNTWGYIYGTGASRPKILFESHLDTVFSETTPLAIVEKDGWIHCPGIGDNASAMALILTVLRAIRYAGLVPVGTLLPAGCAREEGGDLGGIRRLLEEERDVDAAVVVDGGGSERLNHGAVGLKRYEFTFTGPGGHSWHMVGATSTLHAMARAANAIAHIAPNPDSAAGPKTGINIGIVQGGTAVGAIAAKTVMRVDMRSESPQYLAEVERQVLEAVTRGVEEENAFKKNLHGTVSVAWTCFGDVPANKGMRDHPAMQAAYLASKYLGLEPKLDTPSCTNGNITGARGIPTVHMGHGGILKFNHALEECYNPEGNHKAAQRVLLTIFALAGLDGVTEPLTQPLAGHAALP